MTPSPIFCTGTARSGSNLLCRMLTAHPQIAVAVDPFLPLFGALRTALVRRADRAGPAFDPDSPLSDYYFSDQRLGWMDSVQEGSLDEPFDRQERPRLLERARARMQLEAGELVAHLDLLRGESYRQLFDSALGIVARARGGARHRWVGWKEVWTIEFFAPLARAYPQARFLVILRDPRATLASMLGLARRDPSQMAQPLSYLRHWRKYAAFVDRFQALPELEGRLLVVRYEDLVAQPEQAARELCRFLEVEFFPGMLDADAYQDHGTGQRWRGNSSFEDPGSGIAVERAERWRRELEPAMEALADLVCGPEMRLLGYEPRTSGVPSPAILEHLFATQDTRFSWRTDFGDPQVDLGFELFRRALLQGADGRAPPALIRRSFLFERLFRRLREEVSLQKDAC